MAEQVACPNCQRLLEIASDQMGHEVRCPQCQHVFVGRESSGITATSPVPAPRKPVEVQAGLPPWPASAGDSKDDDLELPERPLSTRPFRSGGNLVLAVMAFLVLDLVVGLVMLGSDYMQYNLATRLVARMNVPMHELDSNDARQSVLGIAHFLIYVVTAITFVVWFHRVHANLEALGARDLTYTSGWAAGCWFVPFLNLVRPLQIAQEIWRHSDPQAVGSGRIHSATDANSGLLGLWWAAWIGSNVIAQVSVRMVWAVNSPESLQSATIASMIAEIASVVSALFALAVVRVIDARQTERAAAIDLMTIPAPDDE